MPEDVQRKIELFFCKHRINKYNGGQVLILSGDIPEYVYYLQSGKVKMYDVTHRGDEIILNIFKPPAFFPMSLAINKKPNPYIYEAETAIEVRKAPIDDVVEFIKQNPDVMYDLLSRVYSGVDGLVGRMARLMTDSANDRLIYELVVEARRFGTVQNNGSVLVNISEKELGARSGLSRETVSREARKLKSSGNIAIEHGTIVINNLSLLEKLSGLEI